MPQPGVFRWKMSASLEGQEQLLKSLLERADHDAQVECLTKIAKLIMLEVDLLVPRKSGQLETEVVVFYDGDLPTGVGVPATSPSIDAAFATEYGSWNFDVGGPGSPKTDWPTKSKPTAAMPWLRTSALVATPRALRYLRRFFITGKRGMTDDP
jgi:hypothetical protein